MAVTIERKRRNRTAGSRGERRRGEEKTHEGKKAIPSVFTSKSSFCLPIDVLESLICF